MPSPMDERDNLVNIEPAPQSPPDGMLKRKLDGSVDEFSFPCKKVAVSPPSLNKSSSSDGTTNNTHKPASNPPQPKLSKAEREAVKAEKAKERELERQKREAEKAKREEEKVKKEEERVKKAAERDEMKRRRESEKEDARREREKKEREREEQKRKKEEELEKKNKEKEEQRRKKEEEIEKKNKAQLRLNDFFLAPKKKPDSPVPLKDVSTSDYEKYFQPFNVRQDVIVAPINQFLPNTSTLKSDTARIDTALKTPPPNLHSPSISPYYRISILLPVCKSHRQHPRGRPLRHTAKDLITLLNDPTPTPLDPYTHLRALPLKHLHFAEDVRPAYNGTFTRRARLTPRNPFRRDPDVFAYEYDSEAEWEFEPEDGENLDEDSGDDDGSMIEESGDEEDRAFLDDEDVDDEGNVQGDVKRGKKGKRFVAPIVPVVRGVSWEEGGVQGDEVLRWMRARILLCDEDGRGFEGPIDPLSGKYWVQDMPPPPAPKGDAHMVLKRADASGTVELVKSTGSKSKAVFPESILGDFLKAIQGATHNQILLVELLKKQFPAATKGGIVEKLKEVAFRTGRKDTDHWEIRREYLDFLSS